MFDYFSILLFKITGGVALVNTLLFIPYLLLVAVVAALPIFFLMHRSKNIIYLYMAMISFLLIIFIGISPGIIQQKMLIECRNVILRGSTELTKDYNISATECRAKENFYGTFGEWEITKFK